MNRIWINRIVTITLYIICIVIIEKLQIKGAYAFLLGFLFCPSMLFVLKSLKELWGNEYNEKTRDL